MGKKRGISLKIIFRWQAPERYSTSFATRGMKIKATMRYHYMPNRVAKEQMGTLSAGKDAEK